jgi:hypothetical protein
VLDYFRNSSAEDGHLNADTTKRVHVAAREALADVRDQDAADYKIPNGLRHSRKQDLAIDVGLGLRTTREMANIGNFENMPSIPFNLWRK